MIVDSSAIVAILRDEPEAASLLAVMGGTQRVSIGAPTALESSMALGPGRQHALHAFLDGQNITVAAFTRTHLQAAQEAFASYGKGAGSKARLNYGDCMSYALAKVTGETLLFKGDDFTHTDIEAAWLPG